MGSKIPPISSRAWTYRPAVQDQNALRRFDEARERELSASPAAELQAQYGALLNGMGNSRLFVSHLTRAVSGVLNGQITGEGGSIPTFFSCMDPRVAVKGLALGGQGILLALEIGRSLNSNRAIPGWEAMRAGMEFLIQILREFLKTGEIYAILSHADCAAAQLAFDALSPEEKVHFENKDNLIFQFSWEIARRLNLPHAQVTPDRMNQPLPDMNRKAIIYDRTGFPWGRILDPRGYFLVNSGLLQPLPASSRFTPEEAGIDQLVTGLRVILKPDNPDQGRPALILAAGAGAMEGQKLAEEAQEAIDRVKQLYPHIPDDRMEVSDILSTPELGVSRAFFSPTPVQLPRRSTSDTDGHASSSWNRPAANKQATQAFESGKVEYFEDIGGPVRRLQERAIVREMHGQSAADYSSRRRTPASAFSGRISQRLARAGARPVHRIAAFRPSGR